MTRGECCLKYLKRGTSPKNQNVMVRRVLDAESNGEGPTSIRASVPEISSVEIVLNNHMFGYLKKHYLEPSLKCLCKDAHTGGWPGSHR